jgi:hypothetical protein
MNPHCEVRIFPRKPDRIFKRITRDHQAAACENAAPVSLNHGLIHFLGTAEIVTIDDKVFPVHRHVCPRLLQEPDWRKVSVRVIIRKLCCR